MNGYCAKCPVLKCDVVRYGYKTLVYCACDMLRSCSMTSLDLPKDIDDVDAHRVLEDMVDSLEVETCSRIEDGWKDCMLQTERMMEKWNV